MKEQILDITKKLYHNHLTPETATNLLLNLFAVSGQSKQLANFCTCKKPWGVGDRCAVCEKQIKIG